MNKFSALLFLCICAFTSLKAQETFGGGEYIIDNSVPCLTDAQRSDMMAKVEANRQQLMAEGRYVTPDPGMRSLLAFDWPLKASDDLSFQSYYGTSNYVDQNMAAGVLDYHCNARTYDGHYGTDIATWPFSWYMVEEDLVEVIAAEAGTILNKYDGYDDDHCSCFGDWNAVYIEHADGSGAWYGHMKKNSLTTKPIGATVTKGEFLGIVASSGCSTGPHLHFEVYDAFGDLIDPYAGDCNALNEDSWWAAQPDNREPTLNALLTHDALPIHGCPGEAEQPFFQNTFYDGDLAYFASYYHDQMAGDAMAFRILKPDGSLWLDFGATNSITYNFSWWWWSWFLPEGGPYGEWSVELDYRSNTYSHSFEYLNGLPAAIEETSLEKSFLHPNPAHHSLEISGSGLIEIYSLTGQQVASFLSLDGTVDISTLLPGIYQVVWTTDGKSALEKLVVL